MQAQLAGGGAIHLGGRAVVTSSHDVVANNVGQHFCQATKLSCYWVMPMDPISSMNIDISYFILIFKSGYTKHKSIRKLGGV